MTFVLALALSACATTPSDKPASLNIVYVVGDGPEATQTAAPENQGANPKAASDSTLRQLFWPLSGH